MTHTYTYALLDVSPECYREIKTKLEAAGYEQAFHEVDGQDVIDISERGSGGDADAGVRVQS